MFLLELLNQVLDFRSVGLEGVDERYARENIPILVEAKKEFARLNLP